MADEQILKTVIIGSGPAGLTAAIYAARANLRPVLLAGMDPGGQLTRTSEVENYPGFRKGITGPQLMEEMLEQAKFCGAELLYEAVEAVALEHKPLTVTYGGGQTLRTHTLIIATGAAPRWLGLPGEKLYSPPKGSGVSSCAVCDGSFYKNQPVAVIGGGDSAMEEATYLSKICSAVTIIHRREVFRASKTMLERARAKPNIHWELNCVVDDIIGDTKTKMLTGIKIRHVPDNKSKEVPLSALFVAIGHIPATNLFRGQLELDLEGYIKVNDRQETNLPGVFAAGDCHDRRYRQAVTAAGMGCRAALEVEHYLTHEGLA